MRNLCKGISSSAKESLLFLIALICTDTPIHINSTVDADLENMYFMDIKMSLFYICKNTYVRIYLIFYICPNSYKQRVSKHFHGT